MEIVSIPCQVWLRWSQGLWAFGQVVWKSQYSWTFRLAQVKTVSRCSSTTLWWHPQPVRYFPDHPEHVGPNFTCLLNMSTVCKWIYHFSSSYCCNQASSQGMTIIYLVQWTQTEAHPKCLFSEIVTTLLKVNCVYHVAELKGQGPPRDSHGTYGCKYLT